MRPVLLAWLARQGLPGWLAPDYFQLAAVATLLGAALASGETPSREAADAGGEGAATPPSALVATGASATSEAAST